MLDNLQRSLQGLQHSLAPVSTPPSSSPDRYLACRKKAHVSAVIESSRYYLYNLPIGHLRISVSKEYEEDANSNSARSTKVRIMFVPPRLVSNTVLRGNFRIYRTSMDESPELTVNLSPISVNQSTALVEAMWDLDIIALRRLFSTGEARATDHIVWAYCLGRCKEPMSLIEVYNIFLENLCRVLTNFRPLL